MRLGGHTVNRAKWRPSVDAGVFGVWALILNRHGPYREVKTRRMSCLSYGINLPSLEGETVEIVLIFHFTKLLVGSLYFRNT